MEFKNIPVGQIVVKDNVRSEQDDQLGDLMDSIEQVDILQPLLVRPARGGKYELVSGHRRLTALKARNEPHAPCVIRKDITDHDRVFIQLVENSQRKQMSATEYVEVFERLRKADRSMSRARIAKMIGRSSEWVAHQYEAVKLASVLVGDGEIPAKEVRTLRAGQIIGRAQRAGLTTKGKRQTTDISVSLINSTTINVRCRDAAVTMRVVEAIDQVRDQIRAEEAS